MPQVFSYSLKVAEIALLCSAGYWSKTWYWLDQYPTGHNNAISATFIEYINMSWTHIKPVLT